MVRAGVAKGWAAEERGWEGEVTDWVVKGLGEEAMAQAVAARGWVEVGMGLAAAAMALAPLVLPLHTQRARSGAPGATTVPAGAILLLDPLWARRQSGFQRRHRPP